MESLLQWWWKDTLHVHTAAATADGVPAAMVVERLPARPYCCSHSRWSPCCNGGGKTPCTSTYCCSHSRGRAASAFPVRPYCWWWKYTLDVYTAGCGRAPCTSILLLVKRHTARVHVHTSSCEKTPCTSQLLVVKTHYARQYCC
jgi:hypothetical protein